MIDPINTSVDSYKVTQSGNIGGPDKDNADTRACDLPHDQEPSGPKVSPQWSDLSDQAEALVMSYLGVRRAIGIIGLILPLVLGPLGWSILGITIQDNMSSYYHTPLRDVFVGALCAIAVFLFCYRGHDWIESWTANIGCVAAFGVAFFPIDAHHDPLAQSTWTGYVHSLSGGVFFVTLAFYSLYHFPTSTPKDGLLSSKESIRNLVYRVSGVIILLGSGAMGTYLFLLPRSLASFLDDYNFLFWMEWISVWAFASAWLTKGRAMVADVAVELVLTQAHFIESRLKERLTRIK